MQNIVAIHKVYEQLGPDIAIRICTALIHVFQSDTGLLYEVPGGDLFDGVPPAASTGAVVSDVGLARNISIPFGRIAADISRSLCQIVMIFKTDLEIYHILVHVKSH